MPWPAAPPMPDKSPWTSRIVGTDEAGQRLDVWLARIREGDSRSRVQRDLEEGLVRVNGGAVKAGWKLRAGDDVSWASRLPEPSVLTPEAIPLDILYEDEDLIVVNKPPGLVVHPGAGHRTGTLVHALLASCRDLSGIGGVLRPGIVHRLDKDTSGVMLVAKNDAAHTALSAAFKGREIRKTYLALVYGDFREDEGVIDLPIGRDPAHRQRMSTRSPRGKAALSRWQVKERFGVLTELAVVIETGRTHQIRVHLSAIGRPVVGDPVYGRARDLRGTLPSAVADRLRRLNRQALHAAELAFTHPRTGQPLTFAAPLPEDLASLLRGLRGEGA